VITGAGRRRSWPLDVKARIVMESLENGAVISEVARRHGIRPQQLFACRKQVREHVPTASFAPVHAVRQLAGFNGIVQVGGYVAYDPLIKAKRVGGPLMLAFCWCHFRRRFYDLSKGGNAPIATEALQSIGELYRIEADNRGCSADERRARQGRTKPLIESLKTWLEKQIARIPGRSAIAKGIRYGLSHWDGLTRFIDDGRIEIDSNTVERSIRPLPSIARTHCSPAATRAGPIGRSSRR
jgi:hypothetical protein